ncbi:MAG: FtsQ-type POTRA domain-containing protein [Chloroflexi bacterium]|nr:FtsQ-type POTRA domain-containing protein [Chloroflexota bacterium]
MKLKANRKDPSRRAGGASRPMARRPGARPRNRMARRPGVPLRRRIGGRLPTLGRILALLGAVAAAVALVALVTGPWVRVADVSWAGSRYTPHDELDRVLADQRGAAVLAVDTTAVRDRLEALPSVMEARVSADLTGALSASIVEPEPTFVWETARARLVGGADGILFAVLDREAALPDDLRGLATVVDDRFEGRLLAIGDRIPAALLRTASALSELDPAALGSEARSLAVAVDDDHGFRLRSDDPEWEVAFGVYGLDPRETAASADARLERQVTAVRTLFATRSEAEIGWVDVRNPGKVYFRAKG